MFAAGVAGVSAASAQEFCVACTGPAAIYRCTIVDAVPTGVPLSRLCVETMARSGGHQSCAIRGGTVFDCDGPRRRIDARSAAEALSGSKVAPSAPAPGQSPGKTPGQGPAQLPGHVPGQSPERAPPAAAPSSTPAAPRVPPAASPARPEVPQPTRPDVPSNATRPEPPDARSGPRTMEEAARNLSRATREGLDQAGDQIGSGARKVWRCLSSAFTSC